MHPYSRKHFLQSSAVLLAATACTGFSFDVKKKVPKLSFSTLGCPDWTFQQTIDFAAQHGYTGIELRGILRQLDLVKCPEFNTRENRAATVKLMQDKGLQFVDLGSSATMHFADAAKRKENIEEGKRFIDLAQDIKCPYIRVFPNNFLKEQDKETTINLIISGLKELGAYAKGTNVTVLMETHGDVVYTADIEKIMSSAAGENVGLIWDVANMWSITKEPPATVYKTIGKYVKHTHIKDLNIINDKIEYALLGKGQVPLKEALKALTDANYTGFYSFEWEKLWHPELAGSEIALADYPQAIKKFL